MHYRLLVVVMCYYFFVLLLDFFKNRTLNFFLALFLTWLLPPAAEVQMKTAKCAVDDRDGALTCVFDNT